MKEGAKRSSQEKPKKKKVDEDVKTDTLITMMPASLEISLSIPPASSHTKKSWLRSAAVKIRCRPSSNECVRMESVNWSVRGVLRWSAAQAISKLASGLTTGLLPDPEEGHRSLHCFDRPKGNQSRFVSSNSKIAEILIHGHERS